MFNANGSGTGTIATAGIPIQLPFQIPCVRVIISANDNNNNPIVVGNRDVNAAQRRGVILQPGFSQWFYVSSLDQIWVDALDNGAQFSYYYEINK